jgi:hypothetical protein
LPHSELFIDGIWYPSATTIIGAVPKPWLQAWKDRWGERATRKTKIAGAIGDAFHEAIEQQLNTGHFIVKMDAYSSCIPRVNRMMISWMIWADSIDGTIDHTELKVISKAHTYSGTLDAVGMIGKTPMLIDWKSSGRIYDDYQLQLAAYAHAYNEQTGAKVKDGLIVCVSKDKPRFKLTTRLFKLGKRPMKKFLELRAMFDSIQGTK